MFIREIKENDDPMEVRQDWAAYKREKRREREQRAQMMIVAFFLVLGFAFVVGSFIVKVRRDAAERKAAIEMIGGVK